MPTLTYQDLTTLVDPTNNHHLKFTKVDVRRLHDERHDVQYGDEVALVALFTASITADGLAKFQTVESELGENLSAGDAVISVGADAEATSDVFEIDNEDVTRWISDYFQFTFLINGHEHPALRELAMNPTGVLDPPPPVSGPGRSPGGAAGNPARNGGTTGVSLDRRVAIATNEAAAPSVELGLTRYPVGREVKSTRHDFGLPWLRRLNTATLDDDLVDVDVRIEARMPTAPVNADTLVLERTDARLIFGDVELVLDLQVDGAFAKPEDLIDKVFVVPLRSECGTDLRLAATVTGVLHKSAAKKASKKSH